MPSLTKGYVLKQITVVLRDGSNTKHEITGTDISQIARRIYAEWRSPELGQVALLKAVHAVLGHCPTMGEDRTYAAFRSHALGGRKYMTAEAQFEVVERRQVCSSCGGYSYPVIPLGTEKRGLCCYNTYGYCFGCGLVDNNNETTLGLCDTCYEAAGIGSCMTCRAQLDREEVKGGMCVTCALNGHLVNYSASALTLLSPRLRRFAQAMLAARQRPNLIGVELELKARNIATRLSVKDVVGDYAILKSDSSIAPQGFEIVTLPLTLEEHHNAWKPAFADVFKECYVDARTGLHAHHDRPTALVEMKVLHFIAKKENQSFVDAIGGRKENEFCVRYVGRDLSYLRSHFREEHHSAVSRSRHNHDATLEFRIYAATLDFTEFMARLEFGSALIQFAQQTKMEDMLAVNFQKWLGVNRGYPFLQRYLGVTKKHKQSVGYLLTPTLNKLAKRGLTLPTTQFKLVEDKTRAGYRELPRNSRYVPPRPGRSSPLMADFFTANDYNAQVRSLRAARTPGVPTPNPPQRVERGEVGMWPTAPQPLPDAAPGPNPVSGYAFYAPDSSGMDYWAVPGTPIGRYNPLEQFVEDSTDEEDY